MEKEIIDLPEGHTEDENIIANIKQFILRYLTECTIDVRNNTELKLYFSENEIIEKLNKKIRNIEIEDMSENIGMLNVTDKTIYVDRSFFQENIASYDDFKQMLSVYPVMDQILRTYGTFLISTDYNNFNPRVKLSIATFFAAKSMEIDKRKSSIRGLNFYSYSYINPIEENLIRQLGIVFGDDILAETLKKGIHIFTNRADNVTRRNGVGNELISNVANVHIKDIQIIHYEKLLRMYAEIKSGNLSKYILVDNHSKGTILKYEKSNFDFRAIKNMPAAYMLLPLSDEEINFIRKLIRHYSNNEENKTFIEKLYVAERTLYDYSDQSLYILKHFLKRFEKSLVDSINRPLGERTSEFISLVDIRDGEHKFVGSSRTENKLRKINQKSL